MVMMGFFFCEHARDVALLQWTLPIPQTILAVGLKKR